MIECRNINAGVGNFRLHDISFVIPAGAHAVLTGPTASGKTTLLELIAGAMLPTSGQIMANGVDVTLMPPEARSVGLVPQHGYLFPHLDVRQNIEYGAVGGSPADDLAQRFGVDHLMDRPVASLSGGERQLVALCRALAAQPAVLLLDESFSALDASRRSDALREFALLQSERLLTVLHVSHLESDTSIATVRLEMADGTLRVVSIAT
jgi:ABC-type Fe3+/spermidine/putrescine transport system ATPase subunit